jgi:DNA-binding CsgD family transcriptional regulator
MRGAGQGGSRASAGRPALVDRELELEALGAALDGARAGKGRLVVVEGHAGLGKSQLLTAVRGFARGTGMAILGARASELERDFPFGVALQLLEPAVAAGPPGERERLLAGAAGLAASLFERSEDRRPEEDIYPLLHGLFWVTSNLAERGALLFAVDDAHWADEPSLRVLLYLAQRLESLPVAVVVTARPGERRREDTLLAKLAATPHAEIVSLAPLSVAAVSRLVGDAYAPGEPTAGFARACAEATGGNPLLLRQLLAEAERREVSPDAAGERAVRELGPEEVSRGVLLRLAELQLGATALARALAVLGDETPLARAAALARLEPGVAAEAADALAAVEILRSGEPLAFVHPIVRAAIYAELPAAERARVHRSAARLLADEQLPPEAVAAHLLAGEPAGEPWAVEALEQAGRRALAAGAPTSAVRYLERALAEPPERGARGELLVALGRAAAAAGDPRAVERLEAAIVGVTDPARRAETLFSIGRAQQARGRHRDAAETFQRAHTQLGDGGGELALRLQAAYIGAARMDVVTLPLAVSRVREARQLGLTGATPGERKLLAHVAYEGALAGTRGDEVTALARAALGDGALLAEESSDGVSVQLAALALAWGDALDAARAALTAAVEDARRRGSPLGYASACHGRAQVHALAGRVDDALADAQSALDGVADGWRLALPGAHAALGRALTERGELDAAAAALELPGGDEAWGHSVWLAQLDEARGWLALARTDPAAALGHFEACRHRQTWVQAPNPAVMPWRSGAALCHAALGDPETARSLAGHELGLAREFGAARPVGGALRTLGLVTPGEAGADLLQEAVATLHSSPARLELARAHVELGAALRRLGRRSAAQEELRPGLDLAHRCGALALAERARDELAAAGARPRRPRISGVDALTASERRTAELAAEGLTNREVAQALFVTVKTVEWHLRNAYVKLGIGSRRELAEALAADGEPAQARP